MTSPPEGPLVLLVEDEPQHLELMKRVLVRAGYRVAEATTGDDAVASLRTPGFACDGLVIDLAVRPSGAAPVMEAALRGGGSPGLVVASGGLPDPRLHETLSAHGGVFLAKPFRPADLLDALSRALATESGEPVP